MRVVYEDNHVIVVYKESGEIVQGDKTGDRPLSEMVKDYIKEKYAKPGQVFLGVVHRLDRPVAGLVVFARTSKALSRLNEMFSKGEVHKAYWAVVQPAGKTGIRGNSFVHSDAQSDGRRGGIARGSDAQNEKGTGGETADSEFKTIISWLVRNEKQNKSYSYVREVPDSKKAMLKYRMIRKGINYDLLEVQLLTGRHHQIRCQLASIGCPIKGDLKYGAKRSNPDGSISLLARHIEFVHPVSKKLILLDSPLPEEFEKFLL
ncbi:MAG: RNA pseudouridine synthase [Bacteroidaceae bacterium]|nr:RNA pseudouridine synthase [Bacteroidaceae bacterium]